MINVILLYRISRRLYLMGVPLLPRIICRLMRLIYSCEIPYTADIHKSVIFSHYGLGVVLGHDVVIEENSKILQNVTIGGRSGILKNPKIGKNVTVGAGACVLGDVIIGDNVTIGANAVVIKDVPRDCIAVGVPAVSKKRKPKKECQNK